MGLLRGAQWSDGIACHVPSNSHLKNLPSSNRTRPRSTRTRIDVGVMRYRKREVVMPRTGSPVQVGQWLALNGPVVALLLVACGSDGASPSGAGGDGGNQMASGGAAGSSGGPGGASGSAGSGGVAGEAGGAGGGISPMTDGGGGSSDGAPSSEGGTGDAGAPSLADVDSTLGGLNQDIPPPSLDCLAVTRVPTVACFSARGEWMGEQIDISCNENVGPSSAGTQPPDRFVGCDTKLPSGDDISIVVRLAGTLVGPTPKAFTFSLPPESDAHTQLDMTEVTKEYGTYSGETFSSRTPTTKP